MRCHFCRDRDAVDPHFHVHDGFLPICETCRRLSIPAKNYQPSVGDCCCVTVKFNSQQETAGIGDDDARPQ
ncbi:hypothetical protein V7x_01700 [Crateriforma conspicua]|uniref:Uncharacterized protein n=1 Tax=Crateriforma conspicua TaxID=2527996 RepID=A0A5C6FQV0_9PLAN|nr:hypothetical protein V7x_01700 [Crateriforma conspicua]